MHAPTRTIPLTSGMPLHPHGADAETSEAEAERVLREPRPRPYEEALALLADGRIELEGRLAWGSNDTLLCRLEGADARAHAVYKPRSGERPLWDFPAGTLCRREVAAYAVCEALGWAFVPPTRLRTGPLGPGALQLWIPHDPAEHYLEMDELDPDAARRIAAFDLVINNADRKSGHVLRSGDGRLWAIDHGVSFHVVPKLRTVIWDFAGQPLPPGAGADLARLARELAPGGPTRASLAPLLDDAELDALAQRASALRASGVLPAPDEDRRHFPWPPV